MFFAVLFGIGSCGGGSSSSAPAPLVPPAANSAPLATDDALTVVINNDTDSDGTLHTMMVVKNMNTGKVRV